ncbi:uncharacterized protein METZ01_LOCUS99166 [marine metagenome]|uniref:Uncharacterized protein n=1 Tax=marine metagenome TaxID=408172 RepID=A0A381W1F5_9ZZZZ
MRLLQLTQDDAIPGVTLMAESNVMRRLG